jgi:SOS response regulatory protein OraA/RecX
MLMKILSNKNVFEQNVKTRSRTKDADLNIVEQKLIRTKRQNVQSDKRFRYKYCRTKMYSNKTSKRAVGQKIQI